MGSINAANTYGLRGYGAIAPGYRADLVLFDNLTDFNPLLVMTGGQVFSPNLELPIKPDPKIYNSVHLALRKPHSLDLPVRGKTPVLCLRENELITDAQVADVPAENGLFAARDGFTKIAVLERHHASGRVGIGVMRGLPIKNGAIATTVGHDSHNLIVAGDNDQDMEKAVDALEGCGGGYVAVGSGRVLAKLPLPVAGLMSDAPLETILSAQRSLLAAAKSLGLSAGSDPFIRLSFIALPVIPSIRLTDMGMFDVDNMRFYDKAE